MSMTRPRAGEPCPQCKAPLVGLATKCWAGVSGCGWTLAESEAHQPRRPLDSGKDATAQLDGPPSLRLALPLPENRANARWHWRTELRKKHAYWRACDVYAGALPTWSEVPEKVRVEATLYVHSRMDEGNSLARLKWTEDWLVHNGYARDDAPEHWQYAGIPAQEIDRTDPRVELTLTAVQQPEAA